jgi:FAD-linked oxidoreductase
LTAQHTRMSSIEHEKTGWSNWSGSVHAHPQAVARPRDEAELAAAIRDARTVRAIGAGHSFMPLCASDDMIVSLDQMAGALHVADDRQTVRVPGGWSLKRLTQALWDEGLALANQGDVNPQSVAGSIATGTHGTGRALGSLSTFARGFRMILVDGEAVWCDAQTRPDLYQAQRLSLGLFGIATEIDLAVVPAFHLAERVVKMPWAEVRESFDALVEQHRHIEFFFFPHADDVILKTLDETDACAAPAPGSDSEEAAFRRMLDIGALAPFLIPTLQRAMMRTPMNGRRRGPAHAIFPSDRTLRFEEMEYEMPRAVGLDTLDEVVRWIRAKRLPVAFPFEYRIVAADDIWMSPMNDSPCASISMHQYHKQRWAGLFADAERIFRAGGGRPHWAKRHTLTRTDVDALYPMAERYRMVRRSVDPDGKFLNPHLSELFS